MREDSDDRERPSERVAGERVQRESERQRASRGRGRMERIAEWAAATLGAGAGVWMLLGLLEWHPGPLAWLVALAPWALVPAVMAIPLGALSRQWTPFFSGLAVACVAVALQAPLFSAAAPAPDARPVLTVATLNTLHGRAEPDAVVALVRDHGVDVLALEELTPQALRDLDRAGLDDLLPYRVDATAPGATGTALLSRTRLDDAESLDGLTFHAVSARVDVAGETVTVAAVHPAPPGLWNHHAWSRDLAQLGDAMESVEGPVLLAGDFNATLEHAGTGRLMDQGFSDAVEEAGAGFLPTFPANRSIPPLVAIDHIMRRGGNFTAIDAQVVTVPGSDHRALVVIYAGP